MGIMSRRRKLREEKWELKQEVKELEKQQKSIRQETEELLRSLDKLHDDEKQAIKNNDSTKIALISAKIEEVKEKIDRNDKRYANNTTSLENFSKTRKNDAERECSKLNSLIGAITGLGSLTLGGIGLKMAYDSDMEGALVNKKTLDWVAKLPIFRGFKK